MRLFLAICLSEEMRKALKKLQSVMERKGFGGRFSPEENLHLTLAFIGEYGDPDAVLDALEDIRIQPFELKLRGIGSFGDIWWAGLEESAELDQLAASIRHTLAEAGIPFDRKGFTPHITLLRDAVLPDELPEIRVPDVSMPVNGFSLMRSERGKHGMIYTEVGYIGDGD